MLKRVLKVLLLFIVLLVISVVLLLNSVNTERNKRAIQQTVLSNTGYELTIAGDMEISLYPSLGLTLNDVRLKNPDSPQELASTSAAVLQVNVPALIGGELLIEELSTDDFHINYYVDAQGQSIWNVDRAADIGIGETVAAELEETLAQAEQQVASIGADVDDDTVTVSFQRLRISNGSVDIQDLSRGIRYNLNNLDLESDDTNLQGRPFDIDLNFDFLNSGMSTSTNMGLRSNIVADVNNGNISIEELNFNITPMLLRGEINFSNINDVLVFEGNLESNSFDVMGLMQTLGMAEAEQDFTAPSANSENQQLAFSLSFSGDESQLSIPNLTATLGETELEADANMRFATEFTPNNISYNVISSGIDLTPFLSQDEDTTTSGPGSIQSTTSNLPTSPPPRPQTDVELPDSFIRTVNVLGSIEIESVTANDILFNDLNIYTYVEDGVLDVELQPISVYGGTIQGNVRLDANNEDTNLTTQLSLSDLNIVDLAPSISRLNSVTGKLNVEVDYEASGSSSSELLESISGTTSFAITENSVDIGVLKQVFTAISALSPTGGSIQQWPDVIQFSELGGVILLEAGIRENQQVQLRMDNFDISGSGGIDLTGRSFDYDMSFTILGEPHLQTIQVDELYHNVSWPVECSADFDDEVAQYCRPDFTQVREIFTQLGTNAVRNRVNDALEEQLPDAARNLLRDLFN